MGIALAHSFRLSRMPAVGEFLLAVLCLSFLPAGGFIVNDTTLRVILLRFSMRSLPPARSRFRCGRYASPLPVIHDLRSAAPRPDARVLRICRVASSGNPAVLPCEFQLQPRAR